MYKKKVALLHNYLWFYLWIVLTIHCGRKDQDSPAVDASPGLQSPGLTAENLEKQQKERLLSRIHAPHGWQNLPILFSMDSKFNDEQRAMLAEAMQMWNEAAGIELLHIADTSLLNELAPLYDNLLDSINGLYLYENWNCTYKRPEVLGTTIWNYSSNIPGLMVTADIVFNGQFFDLKDNIKSGNSAEKEAVDLLSLALHELGHLLGLAHVSAQDEPNSIMVPKLLIGEGTYQRKLSELDIQRIQAIYLTKDFKADDVTKLSIFGQTYLQFETSDAPDESNAAFTEDKLPECKERASPDVTQATPKKGRIRKSSG